MVVIASAEGDAAMTGRDNGANARPAIMKIATTRRMVIWRYMRSKSHIRTEIESLTGNDTVIGKNRGMATAAVAATQGALREAHLKYHLSTVAILSHGQMQLYADLRGYGGPAKHQHN